MPGLRTPEGTAEMTSSNTLSRRLPPVPSLLLAGSVILVAAACAAVGTGAPSGTAGVPASPSPTTVPSPTATPVPATASPAQSVTPTAGPSADTDPGSDAIPMKVDLANATHHKVYVDIVDQSGKVVAGTSGKPGDGASVATKTLKVENIDSKTLRLTWTDIPGNNALGLYIDKSLTHFVLVQPEHDGDAIPFDRILILKFSQPVSAQNIEAVLQNGTDTIG
jgi:hypothetical protein